VFHSHILSRYNTNEILMDVMHNVVQGKTVGQGFVRIKVVHIIALSN
jgi:hypothetical protein